MDCSWTLTFSYAWTTYLHTYMLLFVNFDTT
mgnify:CR=1 FL=1